MCISEDLLLVSQHSTVASEAWKYLRGTLHPAVFNHSVRTYVYASAHREHTAGNSHFQDQTAGAGPPTDERLFLACLFHDSGTADAFNGTQRFEVDGADAAASFLTRSGWDSVAVQEVWNAVALHTSPGIAERMPGIVADVRLGVRVDFGDATILPPSRLGELSKSLEPNFARVDIESVLGTLIVDQALVRRSKAPASSWPNALLEEYLRNPNQEGVNPAF